MKYRISPLNCIVSFQVVYLKGLLLEFFGTAPLENKLFGDSKDIETSLDEIKKRVSFKGHQKIIMGR